MALDPQLLSNVANIAGHVAKVVDITGNISREINSVLRDGITETTGIYAQYLGKIDARLQESDNTGRKFETIAASINDAILQSPYIKLKDLIENLAKLTEEGINYNLELRAYLSTLSDKMVTTFNMLDSTLTRLVRLLQSDVSMPEMGSQALLTQYLNTFFQDTSYLGTNGGLYSSVLKAILDAIGLLSVSEGTAYNYNVLKWLGALYSVGMSEETIGKLATGVNYLTTGNVSLISNDNALNTLFSIAATNANMNYADILTLGLNASSVNTLLQSVVNLLASINTTGNQVIKSLWAQTLGITLSDIKAANTIVAESSSILANTITYENAISEVNKLLSYVPSRTNVQEMIDNAMSNFLVGTGILFFEENSASGYFRYRVGLIVGDAFASAGSAFGDNILGNLVEGISNIITFVDTVKQTGGLIDLVGRLSSLLPQNLINSDQGLQGFGWEQYTSRGDIGGGILGYNGGNSSGYTGTSYSASISNAYSSDMSVPTFELQASSIQAYNVESGTGIVRSASDIYSELFELQIHPVRVKIAELEEEALEAIYDKMEVKLNTESTDLIRDTIVDGVVDIALTNTLASLIHNTFD